MSHQITYNDFRELTTEVLLASSSDKDGHWKQLAAVVHIVRTEDTEYVLRTIDNGIRKFQFLSDAILAYNAEQG